MNRDLHVAVHPFYSTCLVRFEDTQRNLHIHEVEANLNYDRSR